MASAAAISGSSASPPISGLTVAASAPQPGDLPPRRLDGAEQRLAVGGGAHRDVAALAVGDHQQPRLAGGGDDRLERPPARPAEALEAGELRLGGDAGGAGRRDQRQAVLGDRVGRGLGGSARRPRARPQRGRIGVEPEADLAAALVDERREPVGERLAQGALAALDAWT